MEFQWAPRNTLILSTSVLTLRQLGECLEKSQIGNHNPFLQQSLVDINKKQGSPISLEDLVKGINQSIDENKELLVETILKELGEEAIDGVCLKEIFQSLGISLSVDEIVSILDKVASDSEKMNRKDI